MKDHWMNVGHDEEELKPYIEPEADFSDTSRIGMSDCTCVCVDVTPNVTSRLLIL